MKPRFFNHYEIVRRLGSGGGGVVYQANDTRLMRPVVLKMLHQGSGNAQRERILAEARLASAIDHPNVCAIYDVEESDEQAVIVMQFVPGRTLDELIAAGPLSLQLASSIGIQIADGLAGAHQHRILHRDLKPQNVMVTDGGLVKILDFGTARRLETGTPAKGVPRKRATPQYATVAYMAPEQFVTGSSSEQSDIFALGLLLYELFTGSHPFLGEPSLRHQVARAIQFVEPIGPRERRPELSPEIERLILGAMAKNPSERFTQAAEVRDALKTSMRSMHFELGMVLPAPGSDDRRSNGNGNGGGLLAMLTERFLRATPADAQRNTIAVLPFVDLGKRDETAFFGFALADAVATRLARLSSLVVRSTAALAAAATAPADPLEAGRQLAATHVVSGNFLRSARGFDLSWQLLEVSGNVVRAGGSIVVPSLNLIAAQNEICDQVFAAVRGAGQLERAPGASNRPPAVEPELAEEYLQARALLSKFAYRSSHRDDLDAAQTGFADVLRQTPDYAPAHSGLGVTRLFAVRRGFGGVAELLEAQRCFERALVHDPDLVEADLYRVETLLSRGEKESARHGVHRLLEAAPHDFDVHVVAGVILQRDGLYDAALSQFGTALRLNPAGATVVYNNRARVHHYQGYLELAHQEIKKGLALEPQHALLRTSLGYLYLRQRETARAIATLEGVIADDPKLRMAYPTLAMAHVVAGDRAEAAKLIAADTLEAAEADCEMAYRLATYFALDGDAPEALHWLRRAIYLGNENYPWFSRNPAWAAVRDDDDFDRVLSALKRTWRANVQRWSQLIGEQG